MTTREDLINKYKDRLLYKNFVVEVNGVKVGYVNLSNDGSAGVNHTEEMPKVFEEVYLEEFIRDEFFDKAPKEDEFEYSFKYQVYRDSPFEDVTIHCKRVPLSEDSDSRPSYDMLSLECEKEEAEKILKISLD